MDTIVTIGDTVRLHGTGTGPNGSKVSLAWDARNTGIFIPSASGDTALIMSKDTGLAYHVLRVTDDSGTTAFDTVRTKVINDMPIVRIRIESRPFSKGGGYSLGSDTEDRGRITARKWRFGSGAPWVPSSGEDTALSPSEVGSGEYRISVQVTDEDGNSSLAESTFNASKWSFVGYKKNGISVGRFGMTVGSRLFFDAGIFGLRAAISQEQLMEYDPELDSIIGYRAAPDGNVFRALTGFNGKLYSFGGTDFLKSDFSVNEMTPLSAHGEWIRKKDMPRGAPATGTGAVACDGLISLMGGTGRETLVQKYDPALDSWDSIPDAPLPLVDPGLIAAHGKIYVLGGSPESRLLFEFDPSGNAWKPKASAPASLVNVVPVIINGKIYVVSRNKTMNLTLEYDPAADTWKEKRIFIPVVGQSSPLENLALVASKDRIFALEGMAEIKSLTFGRSLRIQTYLPGDDP